MREYVIVDKINEDISWREIQSYVKIQQDFKNKKVDVMY